MASSDQRLNDLLAQLPTIANNMYSEDEKVVFEAVKNVRVMLSFESAPPIQQIIEAGLVPRMIQLVQFGGTECQYEAGWALTNIASGNPQQTLVLVQSGAIPIFVEMLNSPIKKVAEQVLWCLGNIAGDSIDLRNLVLNNFAIENIIKLMHRNIQDVSLLRNVAWTFSNFCRGKPHPSKQHVDLFLPYLAKFLDATDQDILVDTIWSFAFITDTTSDWLINAVIELNVIPRIMKYLGTNESVKLLVPSLRSVGNILSGNDVQTQYILNHGVIERFNELVTHPKANIRKEVVWSVSNITSGTRPQIQAIVDSGILKELTTRVIAKREQQDLLKEIMWALVNASTGGSITQLEYLVNINTIQSLMVVLREQYASMYSLVLEGCANLLNQDTNLPQCNIVRTFIDEDFRSVVQQIQTEQPEEIEKFVQMLNNQDIMLKFWSSDDPLIEGLNQMNIDQ
ncbi:hypothetical protein SAMD00019534_121060, partial [Acytostelium subglobosum LB1]|uniref:hypothetical protein n=1 Tax=Acytostelium subglobosum LB1 TaxID=1410327 RepID=UPI000644D84F